MAGDDEGTRRAHPREDRLRGPIEASAMIPKRTIRDETGVLFYRWRLLKLSKVELYLHHYMKSDSARGLHDHPWKWAVALPLYPGYKEYRFNRFDARSTASRSSLLADRRRRLPLVLYTLGLQDYHRIELDKGPSWSLFLAGPRVKQWGFLYPDGRYELNPDNPDRWV